MHMFTHAHVYTIHYIELLKVHLMNDDEIRMSLSSFVRDWQLLKEERCSFRISDLETFVSQLRLRNKQKGI